MPCPYLKKSFLGYKCLKINKIVNPNEMGCFENYEDCKFFKETKKEMKKTDLGARCDKCVFYSALTGRCVKLGVKVTNPLAPPCNGKSFKRR